MIVTPETEIMIQKEIDQLKSAALVHVLSNGAINKRNQGFPERMKKVIAAEQGWKCNVCDIMLPANYQVDHTLAISFGGSNHKTNGQALCVECQKKKSKAECKKRTELKIADPYTAYFYET